MSFLSIHPSRWSAAALVHRRDRGLSTAASVPTLTDAEQVLYRFVRDTSLTAVGTDAALHYRTSGGAWRRIAWTDLAVASWSARTRTVELRTVERDESIALAADPTLAAFAAERIAHLRILRHRVELRPGVFGVVEAIRVSDRAAPQWRVHLDDPAHQHDPLVRQACRDVIGELRSLTGIGGQGGT
jgi:hypothetical protein